MPTTPTLDRERTDQLRTFLVVEAATDVASTPRALPAAHRRAPRIVAGALAAVALGGALFVATSINGGPGTPPPMRADAAVAIEQADGWTTISVTNPDATPAEIAAALEAAGIKTRITPGDAHGPVHSLPGTEPADHGTMSFYGIEIGTPGDAHDAFYGVATYEGTEPGDLTGLGVDFALPDDFMLSADQATISTDPADTAPASVHVDSGSFEAVLADLGLKVGGDLPPDTVSIKDGADVEVVLYEKA